MTLVFTQGHRVTRKLELVPLFRCKVVLSGPNRSSDVKLYEVAQTVIQM